MKKKATISIIFLIIIIPVIFATRYFIPKKSIDDIKIIEVSKYSGFGCPVREYVIDFDKNLVTYIIKLMMIISFPAEIFQKKMLNIF